jgi:hypothetical protein
MGFVVYKVALWQVFSEYFGFPCQFSFHRLLHTHNLSSGAGTIGQILADVTSGLSLTPPQETKTSLTPPQETKTNLELNAEGTTCTFISYHQNAGQFVMKKILNKVCENVANFKYGKVLVCFEKIFQNSTFSTAF